MPPHQQQAEAGGDKTAAVEQLRRVESWLEVRLVEQAPEMVAQQPSLGKVQAASFSSSHSLSV